MHRLHRRAVVRRRLGDRPVGEPLAQRGEELGEPHVVHQPEAGEALQVLLELGLGGGALRRGGEDLRRLIGERGAARLVAAADARGCRVEARQQQREVPQVGGHLGRELRRGRGGPAGPGALPVGGR